jgi:hypothetical protein
LWFLNRGAAFFVAAILDEGMPTCRALGRFELVCGARCGNFNAAGMFNAQKKYDQALMWLLWPFDRGGRMLDSH